MSVPGVPVGRYGPAPDARRRRRTVVALWALGAAALALTLWVGLGSARTPVTWQDISFRIDGAEQVEVTYDVSRIDPSVPVRCWVEALNQRYAQVGVAEVDVPPSTERSVRLRSVVRTSEPAVTGVVSRCEAVASDARG